MATSTLPYQSGVDKAHRRVIFASSLGTVFEWYDFYLYGSLAAIISKQFFSGVNETTGFIFALLAFAAGFAVRPFGALVFGRLGDLVGRKHTFLITIVIMGLSTALVGVLPSYAKAGAALSDHHRAHDAGHRRRGVTGDQCSPAELMNPVRAHCASARPSALPRGFRRGGVSLE